MKLDKKNNNIVEGVEIPKESISLTAVFVFLGFILLLLTAMILYLRFSSWSPLADFFKRNMPQNISLSSLYNKDKVNSTNATEIKITEATLGESIGVNKSDFPLKKASLKIKPEGVVIEGKTAAGFWGMPVEVMFEPKTGNGVILLDIKEIKTAGVIAPKKITDTLTPKLNGIFAPAFDSLGNVYIESARTLVGYMIIDVKQK